MVGVGPPKILGVSQFRGLGVGQDVVLRGIRTSLELEDIDGTVWLEDHGFAILDGQLEIDAVGVSALVATRSLLEVPPLVPWGNDAVRVERGEFYMYESSARGQDGRVCAGFGPPVGGDALLLVSAMGAVFDSVLVGGNAASQWGPFFSCDPVFGTEGDAYRGTNGSLLFELGSTFDGDVVGPSQTILGQPRSLQATYLIEEGSLVRLTVTGPPGDLVSVLRSQRLEVSFEPILYGTNLVGPSPEISFHGTLPASGQMDIDVVLPPLPAGREFQRWVFQSLQFDADNAYLSSGSVTHVIERGRLPFP